MNVNSGSPHSESFSITVFQTGKSSLDVSLRSDLFPSESDASEWLCGIESLQVPLDETRYFSESTPTLFNIRRLRHGVAGIPARTHLMREAPFGAAHTLSDLEGWGGGAPPPYNLAQAAASAAERSLTEDTVGTVRTNKREVRELGDFFELITDWYVRFNQMMRTTILTAAYFNQDWNQPTATTEQRRKYEHLKCRITPSGSISFQFSKFFLSMFYVEVSDYAQHVFGLPAILSINLVTGLKRETVVDVAGNMLSLNGAALLDADFDPTNFVLAQNDWITMYAINGTKSIYSSVDTRMSISLSTDLQLGSRSLVIVDGREELNYMLGNFPLDNSFKITSTVEDELKTLFTVTGESRSGHVPLKKPNDPIVEWISLAPDTNIRQFRLRLSLRERKYLGNNVWTSIIGPLPVEVYTFWSCKLVFVRKIH